MVSWCSLPSYLPKHVPGLEIWFLSWFPVCMPSSSLSRPGWCLAGALTTLSSSYYLFLNFCILLLFPLPWFIANCNWMVWKNSLLLNYETQKAKILSTELYTLLLSKTIAMVLLLWSDFLRITASWNYTWGHHYSWACPKFKNWPRLSGTW